MADSYLGFLYTTIPAQVGDLVPPPAAEAPYPTQVLTQSGNVIQMAPGSTTPSSVNIQGMPVIVSLLNKTTDIEYAANTTTITGILEVDEDIIATGDVTGQDIMATNNLSAIDINLTGNININPHNTAPFNNTSYLNTNINIGVSDNGTINLLNAPAVAIYPTSFTVGGVIYPATLCQMSAGTVSLTATADLNLFSAPGIITLSAITPVTGIINLAAGSAVAIEAPDTNVTGQVTIEGGLTVTPGLGTGNITSTTLTTGAVGAGAITCTAITVPGAVTQTLGSVSFGTLVPPAPCLSFNVNTGFGNILAATTFGIQTPALTLTAAQTQMTGNTQIGGTLGVTGRLTVTDISGVATINGAAYPPPGSAPTTWSQYPATSTVTIPSQYTLLTNTLQGNGNAGTSTINVNSPLNMGNLTLTTTSKISSLNAAGFQIEANNLNITGYNNAPALVTFNNASLTGVTSISGVSTINGVAYPPPAQTPSGWALYPAIQTVTIPNPYGLNTNRIGTATPSGSLNITGNPVNFVSSPIIGVTTINGAAYPPPGTNVSTWSTYKATQTVDMSGNALINVSTINGVAYPPPIPTILQGYVPVWTSGSLSFTNVPIPSFAKSFDMIMIGGGGGGGGAASTINAAGGGGASGFVRTITGINLLGPYDGYGFYNATIGAGGAGGTPGNPGVYGSTTTFTLVPNTVSSAQPLTWRIGGGGSGGGASAPVGSGGGPGGVGGAGGGGGWTRAVSAAPGGGGQYNGTQFDNGGSGGTTTGTVTGGDGGENIFGQLPLNYGGSGFAATGGIGGGYGGGYRNGAVGSGTGIPIAGYGGGGGGQNADGSGGQGGGLGGADGAVGNVFIRWYFQ